jgi:archaemetzincin
VVSTFRLGGRRDRLRKVSLHEIGHLLSLPHCQSGTASCLMQDARGRAATVDRTTETLCADCRVGLAW